MESNGTKVTYVLQGWPVKGKVNSPDDMVPLPHSSRVRDWCQAGKKVRITFEVIE